MPEQAPMTCDPNGEALIAASEGLRLVAYADPGTGGEPWTIGYGHTAGVKQFDTCTNEQAHKWLDEDLRWAEQMVWENIKSPMTQGQMNGLTSFCFNLGPGAKGVRDGFMVLRNGNVPTFRKMANAGDWRGCGLQLKQWANPPLLGLRIRRRREAALIWGDHWQDIPDGLEPVWPEN